MEKRTINDINKEYSETCTRIGDLECRKRCIETDLPSLYQKVESLVREGITLQETKLAEVKPMTGTPATDTTPSV